MGRGQYRIDPAVGPDARKDLSNARLLGLVVAAASIVTIWMIARPWLREALRTPGSPVLQLAGIAGAVLLLVPVAFAAAKRSGAPDPNAWFRFHVRCSLVGAVLIAIHSAGLLRRPPALLLVVIAALVLLGVWGRLAGARRMAATFASKAPRFQPPDRAACAELRRVLVVKRKLVKKLDPAASENTFSVTLAHARGHPLLAFEYRRLEARERSLLATRQAVNAGQRWWRPLHQVLTGLLTLGIVIHVVTVTFFAGYVAGGNPITWWHFAEW